jgi:hypothetical protein
MKMANTEKNQPEQTESPVITEKMWLTIDKIRAPQFEEISNDDLDELVAYFRSPNRTTGLPELWYRIDSNIRDAEFNAAQTLSTMEGIYSDFKKDLQRTWPNLADKTFGFTMADDGRLQVTAPPNTLNAWEEETLNTLLNEIKDLQSLTLKHAKTVIELVRIDREYFEGTLNVNLTNFHKMIDYGLVLNKGALELRSPDSWLDQLYKNAEKDPFEKKQGLHIEA